MKRAVLDTNIIVSGMLWTGSPLKALSAARADKVELLITNDLIAELSRVLSRSKFVARFLLIGETVEGAIAEYEELVTLVEPAPIPPIILADPDDDLFIACAVGGKADIIVSGDQHLLELGNYKGILIQDVYQFLAGLNQETASE